MKCAGLLALNTSCVSKKSDLVVYVIGMTYFLLKYLEIMAKVGFKIVEMAHSSLQVL